MNIELLQGAALSSNLNTIEDFSAIKEVEDKCKNANSDMLSIREITYQSQE